MPSLLFWNINGKSQSPVFQALAQEIKAAPIEIVLLAECDSDMPAEQVAHCLTDQSGVTYRCATSRPGGSKVLVFTSLAEEDLSFERNSKSGRLAVYRLWCGNIDFLIATVHLTSEQHQTDGGHNDLAGEECREFREFEEKYNHKRSLVIGDFNLDPYDPGMTSAVNFNAVMTRRLADKIEHQVSFREYLRFYNPMWSMFGDHKSSKEPPGTFYYSSGGARGAYWHIFDQALFRGPALREFAALDISILSHLGIVSLLTESEIPNQTVFSDHLPIRVRFEVKDQDKFPVDFLRK